MKASTDRRDSPAILTIARQPAVERLAREILIRPRYATQRPGLNRIRRLLGVCPEPESFVDPELSFETIHVVGSNGKGSVSVMIAEILRALGLRVGLFTSPHLFSFTERFWIDGAAADGGTLVEAMEWLRPRLAAEPDDDPALAFDAMTALAVGVFTNQEVEVVVAEAGIGGRFDSTRALAGSAAALVSVDLEHTALLGDSHEAIAVDKSQIVGPGGVLVLGDLGESVAEAVRSACGRRQVLVERLGDRCRFRSLGVDRMRLAQDGVTWPSLNLGLWGQHQHHNAALAVVTAARWLQRSGRRPAVEGWRMAVEKGMARAHRPGRLEKVSDQPAIWLDVAHTPAALRATVAAATSIQNEPWTVVFTLSADKTSRTQEMMAILRPIAGLVICTRSSHRSGDPSTLVNGARHLGLPHRRHDDLPQALAAAAESGNPVLVTGGLFLVAEAATILAGGNPADLLFF